VLATTQVSGKSCEHSHIIIREAMQIAASLPLTCYRNSIKPFKLSNLIRSFRLFCPGMNENTKA
jgi:hypothetical protein